MSKDNQLKNTSSENENEEANFSVSVKTLSTMHVASIACKVNMASGEHSQDIGDCFKQVSDWAKNLDPSDAEARLRAENEGLRLQLEQAQTIIDVQKNSRNS